MRQAVSFKCTVCQQAIKAQVTIQSSFPASPCTVRFCTWACLVAWVTRGG